MASDDCGELDEESYQEAIREMARDLLNPRTVGNLSSRHSTNIYDLIEEYVCNHGLVDTSDYYLRNENDWDLPSMVEAVSDSSVSGPELRTIGALTAAQFSEQLRELLASSIQVDTRCSFHVHLSLPGVKHGYGKEFQAVMYEYIMANINRVPASVKERWNNSTSYFKPELGTNKYTFIHFHRQGTWEFRCWGNIDDYRDGMQCLRLSVEALQEAYRVIHLGLPRSMPIFGKELITRIEEKMHVAIAMEPNDARIAIKRINITLNPKLLHGPNRNDIKGLVPTQDGYRTAEELGEPRF